MYSFPGFNAAGGGGYGGGMSGPPDNGSYGATGGDIAGSVTLPMASQSLGGFVGGGQPKAGGARGGPRSGESLTPLTIRMLLDAHDLQKQQGEGPDAPLIVNDREVNIFTLVGCLESVHEQMQFKLYNINDGTGRIQARLYTDTCHAADPVPGDYVRVHGRLNTFSGTLQVGAHDIRCVESSNEVAYHFVEVVHVHLTLSGKLQKSTPATFASPQQQPPQQPMQHQQPPPTIRSAGAPRLGAGNAGGGPGSAAGTGFGGQGFGGQGFGGQQGLGGQQQGFGNRLQGGGQQSFGGPQQGFGGQQQQQQGFAGQQPQQGLGGQQQQSFGGQQQPSAAPCFGGQGQGHGGFGGQAPAPTSAAPQQGFGGQGFGGQGFGGQGFIGQGGPAGQSEQPFGQAESRNQPPLPGPWTASRPMR